MQHNVKKILKQRQRAVSRRETWRGLLEEAYRYAIPNRNPWEQTYIGAGLAEIVYDTTLISAHRKFVNRMINALTPPGANWLKFIPGSKFKRTLEDGLEPPELTQLQEDLQQLTETFFFYLRKSNFDLAIYEAFGDMAVSTGVMQIIEGDAENPFIFSVVPSDSVAFDGDARGNLNKFYRDWHRVHYYDAEDMWQGFELAEQHKHKDIDDLYLTLYEITVWCHEDKVYKHYVIDKEAEHVSYYAESDSTEWVAFRWSRLPCENAGRGPVLDALPSAMTLNKAIEFELKAAALNATPPYMAYTNALINPYTFRVEPNTVIPVNQTMSGSWPIAPLPSGSDITFSQVVVQDLRNAVNEIMLAMPIQPPTDQPVRTATEIAIQQQNLRENAAASFSRIQRELFEPLVDRCLHILTKLNLIDKVVIDDIEVSVAYETPIVQSRDEIDAEKFIQFFQFLASIYQPGLAVAALNNADVVLYLANKLGIDMRLIKDYASLQQLIEQGEQAAEQAITEQQPEAVNPIEQLASMFG